VRGGKEGEGSEHKKVEQKEQGHNVSESTYISLHTADCV